MPNIKMGFEGELFYGTAGAQATIKLTNTKDITVGLDNETGETTIRGDGTSPPVKTESVTARMITLEFVMIHDSTDAEFLLMMAAVRDGTAVALRGKDYSGGKGPDADFTLKASLPWPLAGEQVVTFTATPTLDNSRTPSLWA